MDARVLLSISLCLALCAAGASGTDCTPGCWWCISGEWDCNYGAGNYIVKTERGGSVQIKCEGGQPLTCEAMAVRHNTALGAELSTLHLVGCPVQDVRLKCFVEAFNATSLRMLWIDQNVMLTEDMLEGLHSLQNIRIASDAGQEMSVPISLLPSLPNLTTLSLVGGHISLPAPFPPSPLIHLELSEGGIDTIPAGAFKELQKLKTLQMFKNKLTTVNKEMFEGLSSLEDLELSACGLERLPVDVLAETTPALRQLYAADNALREIPPLGPLRHLETVRLSGNTVALSLSPTALAYLPSLSSVELQESKVHSLPPAVFRGSHNLTELVLYGNQLEELPEDVFQGLSKLESLDLRSNLLSSLPPALLSALPALRALQLGGNRLARLAPTTFAKQRALTLLDLEDNLLEELPDDFLKGASSLSMLNVSRNRLRAIRRYAFGDAGNSLQELNLSWNNLTSVNGDEVSSSPDSYSNLAHSPFNRLRSVRVIDLSHNQIRYMFNNFLTDALHLETLDMSYNEISELESFNVEVTNQDASIDLRHNNISFINLHRVYPPILQRTTNKRATIHIAHNPLACDCRFDRLWYRLHGYHIQFPDDAPTIEANFAVGNMTCSTPEKLKHVPLTKVNLDDLSCIVDEESGCPKHCSCELRCQDKLDMSCPETPEPFPMFPNITVRNIRLQFTDKPGNLQVPEIVATVNLSSLDLHAFDTDLPDTVKEIDLSSNSLTDLPLFLLERNVATSLSNNRFNCDCWTKSSIEKYQRLIDYVRDSDSVRCDDGQLMKTINVNQLCDKINASIIGGTLTLVGILIAASAYLIYRFRLQIQVILYRLGICVKEEDLDRDKKYDAFLSFSHEDEVFVNENLLPGLEEEPYNFKICIHYRDWIPGEFIPAQIERSVDESRRTIIVMSKNFLNSVWGRLEFRAAHMSAIQENRTKIIIVLLEDVSDHKEMDVELKAYLKTNTYIKWKDPYFWDNLRHALPHKDLRMERKQRNKGNKITRGGLDTQLNAEGKLINAAV